MSAVGERMDETAACVMRSLLSMSENMSEDKSMRTKISPTVSQGSNCVSVCYPYSIVRTI